MKTPKLSIVLIAFITVAVAGEENLPSDLIFDTHGTSIDIAKRAQSCSARILRNEPIQLNDASTRSSFGLLVGAKPASVVDGTSVITMADIEGGTIVATHRVRFNSMLISHAAQSVLTIFTKDGRFKMHTSDIEVAQLDTGSAANSGFRKIRESSSTYKTAVKEIMTAEQKVAECIQSDPKNDF
jgi:hypothetical protein